jgi:hypothetical protein
MSPQYIDPCLDGIRPHACLKHIPQWPDNSPRMEALRHEMQRTGFCPVILMTPKHEIVDEISRDRWRAAKALQLDRIACAFVEEHQVDSVMLSVLAQRSHYTRSAIAYLAYPRLASALEEARRHALEMLKKGNVSPSGAPRPTVKTVEELAASLRISATTLKEARRVHEIFAKDATFKAQMEPRLLLEPIGGEHEQNRPVGLGAIIAGYAGKANEDKTRNDRSQLELFSQGLKTFILRAPLPAHEAQARKVIAEQLEKLSPEELDNAQRAAALIVSEAKAIARTSK